jgi:hypothetical protein
MMDDVIWSVSISSLSDHLEGALVGTTTPLCGSAKSVGNIVGKGTIEYHNLHEKFHTTEVNITCLYIKMIVSPPSST